MVNMVNVYVISCEGVTKDNTCESDIVGVYLSEKLAKEAAKDYIDDADFQRKVLKKDDESDKKLLFVEKVKKNPRSIYMITSELDMPEQKGKVKDKNLPKRGLTAYMFFSKENRALIKEANPDATFGDIGKLVGQQWKALTDKQKMPYVKKAAKDQERAKQELTEYRESQTEALETVTKGVEAVTLEGEGEGEDEDEEEVKPKKKTTKKEAA
jgi:hypothetical protein